MKPYLVYLIIFYNVGTLITECYDLKRSFVPRLEVLCRLADAFWDNNLLKKTHIHFASRVNWISFDRYVKWLRERNYIECITIDNVELYKLTQEGREMFSVVLNFKEMVNNGGNPIIPSEIF